MSKWIEKLDQAPYHFINCALNIPACEDPNLRGRASDLFLFSKHFCGSPILGYAPTKEWEALDGHIDLGTAMSISAAAASPQMGVNTKSAISYLLAILNVRLNYWAANPRCPLDPDHPGRPGKKRGWVAVRRRCTPGIGYFLKELIGLRMNEKSIYQNLSDGGHVENLAIYELLRRRCKFIVAIDGEADPERRFQGLLTLVRLANIDLGIRIEPHLDQLRKDDDGNTQEKELAGRPQDEAEQERARRREFHAWNMKTWTVKDWFQGLANSLLDPQDDGEGWEGEDEVQ